MVFTPINVVNGTTPVNATWGNNAQTQYTESTLSFNPDLFAGYVLFGLVATKDAVTASLLDVTAGVAYLLQSDNTTRRNAPVASTQTTSALSSTYFLYLQPAGTWFWSTSNTPAANSLLIAQVTTDGSGNILTVTDKRNLYASVIPNSAGAFAFGLPTNGGMSIDMLGTAVGMGVVAPGAPTATPVSGSGLSVGVYNYKVTYVSFNGECALGTAGTCTTTAPNSKVNLTAIPTGPLGTLKRNIYRTKVGGSIYFLLTTLSDNVTTTYSDTTADTSLVTQAATHPTMGGDFWKSNSGTLLAGIYGDGSATFDTGKIGSDGSGNFITSGWFGTDPTGSGGAWIWIIHTAVTSGATVNKTWEYIYNGADGSIHWNNDTDGQVPLSLGPGGAGNTKIINSGAFSQVAGQAAFGSFGVPVIVSVAANTNVTATTSQLIIDYTLAANGLYRVSFFASVGGSSNTVTATYTFNDQSLGLNTQNFNSTSGSYTSLSAFALGSTKTFFTSSVTIWATTINHIQVHYQNSTGTPNDFVSAMIERLA